MSGIRTCAKWLLLWCSDLLFGLGLWHTRAWWWCITWAAVMEEWRDDARDP